MNHHFHKNDHTCWRLKFKSRGEFQSLKAFKALEVSRGIENGQKWMKGIAINLGIGGVEFLDLQKLPIIWRRGQLMVAEHLLFHIFLCFQDKKWKLRNFFDS